MAGGPGSVDLAGCVRLTWLRQAGFLLEGDGEAVLVDPYLAEDPNLAVPPHGTPEAMADVTVVCATHEHGDHLELPTWTRIAAASSRPVFVLPAPIRGQAEDAGLNAARVIGAFAGVPISVGRVTIHPIRARHGIHAVDAYNFGEAGPGEGSRYLGYVIELGGVRIYHAGDTIPYDGIEETLRALRPDIALLPINGRDYFRERLDIVGNLTPREAADLAASIGVDLVIPMHYETVPGNMESPGVFVDYLRMTHPELTTCLPGRGRSITYCHRGR
jgi:L-ascorbate metabolism protein UlaG (beta-lactamase superfamily)